MLFLTLVFSFHLPFCWHILVRDMGLIDWMVFDLDLAAGANRDIPWSLSRNQTIRLAVHPPAGFIDKVPFLGILSFILEVSTCGILPLSKISQNKALQVWLK